MGCANSVANSSQRRPPPVSTPEHHSEEVLELVDVSIQKDDEEISPLQPYHYNCDKKDAKRSKKFVFSGHDEDWSVKKAQNSNEERPRFQMMRGVERAGTLELDNFELKNEIILKSDNMYAGETHHGSQKMSMELNLDTLEAISFIPDHKYQQHGEATQRKDGELPNHNTRLEEETQKRGKDLDSHSLIETPMLKRNDTEAELIIESFKPRPNRQGTQNKGDQMTAPTFTTSFKQPLGSSISKALPQSTYIMRSQKDEFPGSPPMIAKDTFPLSKLATELPEDSHQPSRTLAIRSQKKGKSKTTIQVDGSPLRSQEKDLEPLQQFLDTVVKALNQHRENNKNTLNPVYFPGRKLTRCATSSPDAFRKSARLSIIINNFKTSLKTRVLAKKSVGTETNHVQPYNPRRNYRTIKQTPLISTQNSKIGKAS